MAVNVHLTDWHGAAIDADLEFRASGRAPDGFLLTYNPDKWNWDERELARAVETTRSGGSCRKVWSMGGRKKGVEAGDRAFLVRLGLHGRGLTASGTIVGPIYRDEHFDGSGRPSNSVLVDWETVLEPGDRLELSELDAALPEQHWHPQGRGIRIRQEVLPQLDELWTAHLSKLGRSVSNPSRRCGPTSSPVGGRRGGQGWQDDPDVRKTVEDAAQARLEEYYRDRGWTVIDKRQGKLGFDALAVKGAEERYLEANGTVTLGASVIVTPAEVEFARRNPGRCVMGILSAVDVNANGEADATSGDFHVLDWDPDTGTLRPRGYDWIPG